MVYITNKIKYGGMDLDIEKVKMLNEPIYCVNCTICVGWSDQDNEEISITCNECKNKSVK
jgi:hypothetical protein